MRRLDLTPRLAPRREGAGQPALAHGRLRVLPGMLRDDREGVQRFFPPPEPPFGFLMPSLGFAVPDVLRLIRQDEVCHGLISRSASSQTATAPRVPEFITTYTRKKRNSSPVRRN